MSIRWRGPLVKGSLLLMESLWAYALVATCVAFVSDRGTPSPLSAIVVVGASFVLSRILQSSDLPQGPLRLWGLAMSAIIFYAVIRIDFTHDFRLWDFSWADDLFNHTEQSLRDRADAVIGVPMLWALWIRGIMRGQQYTTFEDVAGSFGIGLVIVAASQLLASGLDAPAGVGLVAVPYVLVGLMTIGLAHAARDEDQFGKSITPTWILAVAGGLLFMGLIALIFVVIDFGAARGGLGVVGSSIGWVVAKALYYALWPVLRLSEIVLAGFAKFFEDFYGGQQQEPLSETATPTPVGEEEENGEVPAWLRLLVRIVIGVPFVALVLLATAYAFTRLRKRQGPRDARESTYQEGRLQKDLGDLLGNMLNRLRPNFSFGSEGLDPVRKLYYDLLAQGAVRGVERRTGETPIELAPRLDDAFRTEVPSRISNVFDAARYGRVAVPTGEVQTLRDEWEHHKQGR